MICFVLATGHYVGGILLGANSDDLKWFFLGNNVEFVNKDDPEKIRNAIIAGSVSLSQL